MSADAAVPLAFAAVIEGGIEAEVFDQFFGALKAMDVADDGAEGKGDFVPDAAKSHDGQQLGIGQHLLGDEAFPMLAPFLRMAYLHEQAFQYLLLAGRPFSGLQDLLQARRPILQWVVGAETNAVVAEIGEEPVADLGGAPDGFAIGMEPVAPLLGLEIGNPD